MMKLATGRLLCKSVETAESFSTSTFVAPQRVARLKKTEHDLGNGTINDNVSLAVARQSCGDPGKGNKRPRAFVALQCLERCYVGNTPIVTNGSLRRAAICGATDTFVESSHVTYEVTFFENVRG
jgi:hypothetical protein